MSAADTPERVTLAWQDIPLDPTHRELEPVAPVRLTARDGTALDLEEVTAHGAVVGLFAFTELHLTFKNPVARELAGTFAFTLPPSGAVSRFAVPGTRRLMEGEIVEHRLARSVYEDFLPAEVEPALFEHDAANSFSARVFRFAAHAEKRIVLSYSEELGAENPSYRVPLRGLPELQALTVVVHQYDPGGSGKAAPRRRRIYRVQKTRFVPDRDFTLPPARSALPPAQAPSAVAAQAGRFAVVRVTPRIQAVPDRPKKLAILIDTSGSRALSLTRDVERVQKVLAALRAAGAGDLAIQVYAFDQEVEAIYRGPASGFGNDAVKRVLAREARGATDMARALGVAALGDFKDRILLVTDGVFPTVNQGRGPVPLERLTEAGVERLDVLVSGGIPDERWLAGLITSGRRRGVAIEAHVPPSRIAKKLSFSVAQPVDIEVPGASFSYPRTLTGLGPGDSALIYAQLRRGNALKTIRIDRLELAVSVGTAPEALVERAVVRAQIDDIWEHFRAGRYNRQDFERAHSRLLELSTKHRVASPLTSFVVLENEGDYSRFRLDRPALKDFLTVGPDGLAALERGEDWWKKRELLPLHLGSEVPFPHRSASLPSIAPASDRDNDGVPDAVDRCPESGTSSISDSVNPDGCQTPITDHFVHVPGDDPGVYPIEFSQGSASPFDDNLWLISHVLGMMQRDPKLRVVVRGHADDERSAAKNLRLSEDRARVVRDHMISSGASSRRLVATGCGSSRPLAGAHPDQPKHKRFVDFVTVEESFKEALCAAPLPPTPHGQPLRPTVPRPWAKRVPEPPRAPAVYYQPLRKVAPYQGPFADVMADLAAGRSGDALAKARAMHAKDPGAVPSLFALGSSYEALGRPGDAARAYASILDLYPSYAPYRRFAGSLFDRLGIADSPNAARARSLAVDCYRHALSKLPDNASSHRLYAFALLRAGRYQEAFDILDRASQHPFPVHVSNVFESDLALVARAWAAAEPANTGLVTGLLAARHIQIDDRPSLRIALTWEYESDVNLHLDTGQQPQAGDDFPRSFPGRLVTEGGSGLGPAVFMIYGPTSGRTLRLGVHLASISNEKRFTLGKVELIRHDGAGHLSFDERPFALMVREGYAELGSVEI